MTQAHPAGDAIRDIFIGIKDSSSRRDWLTSLPPRKRSELEFHDRVRTPGAEKLPTDTFEALHSNKKFYSVVRDSQGYVEDWIRRNVPGKIFLDYACGNGANTLQAARLGARIAIGLELSSVSIANAEEAARAAGVAEKCIFIQGDCENTGIPADSVDVIICSGMLHHLDLSYAFPELRRILKPGGVVLAIEALDYNPAIKAYRLLTPSMRTAWETVHILSLKDLVFAERFFDLGEVRFWHLAAIAAVAFRRFPSVFESILAILSSFDRIALRIPGLRLLAWQITFELKKRVEG